MRNNGNNNKYGGFGPLLCLGGNVQVMVINTLYVNYSLSRGMKL